VPLNVDTIEISDSRNGLFNDLLNRDRFLRVAQVKDMIPGFIDQLLGAIQCPVQLPARRVCFRQSIGKCLKAQKDALHRLQQ
jgi:hypothetical protein